MGDISSSAQADTELSEEFDTDLSWFKSEWLRGCLILEKSSVVVGCYSVLIASLILLEFNFIKNNL